MSIVINHTNAILNNDVIIILIYNYVIVSTVSHLGITVIITKCS